MTTTSKSKLPCIVDIHVTLTRDINFFNVPAISGIHLHGRDCCTGKRLLKAVFLLTDKTILAYDKRFLLVRRHHSSRVRRDL